MLPFNGESSCDTLIEKAQENIDTILKPNLKEILTELNSKMAKDGIVVYNGYAQYFNTETEACATVSRPAYSCIEIRQAAIPLTSSTGPKMVLS
jgi:hypothetical protein